jgi:hypothetical protein
MVPMMCQFQRGTRWRRLVHGLGMFGAGARAVGVAVNWINFYFHHKTKGEATPKEHADLGAQCLRPS